MSVQRSKLGVTKAWLEGINEHVIGNNNDRVAVVIGDEGAGKSTYMLQMAILWQRIRNAPETNDAILSNILWGGRDAFINAMRNRDEGSMIAVQDAAHVLFSREAMHGSQIEVEKSLLDIRIRNFLIVLGFQDFDDMPSGLKNRRAETAFVLPTDKGQPTGKVKIYNRESMDTRVSTGEWPEQPDKQDRFEDLDGTDLWATFEERDTQAKMDRLLDAEQQSAKDAARAAQQRVALRLYFKREDETYKSISNVLDYSESWVGDQINQWKDDEIDPFGDDDPDIPLPPGN